MKHIENEIRNELRTRGFDLGIEEVEIVKNHVPCTGIRVIRPDHPEIAPVVYYSQQETLEEILQRVLEAAVSKIPDLSVQNLTDPQFVLDHMVLAATKRDGESENVIRRPYLNLDMIMKVQLDGSEETSGSISSKVTTDMLKAAGIDEQHAWDAARANSRDTAQIRSLAEIFPFIVADDGNDSCPMHVASCNNGFNGAAVIAVPEVFREFCTERGLDELFLLPSSTEELVCIPADDCMQPMELVSMVNEINRAEVDPLLQLEPAVYVYHRTDDSITLVATLEGEV